MPLQLIRYSNVHVHASYRCIYRINFEQYLLFADAEFTRQIFENMKATQIGLGHNEFSALDKLASTSASVTVSHVTERSGGNSCSECISIYLYYSMHLTNVHCNKW